MDHYVAEVQRIFRASPDKHGAHDRSAAVLQAMADDPAAMREALRRHIADPRSLRGHYPVVSILVASTPDFELVANYWLPLPDRAVDVTTKAIHHHGPMLLTTVTAFGHGYEHWTFAPPRLRDAERELFELEVIEHGPHPLGHAAFVDAYVAHVPLFVPTLTVTLALWSSHNRTSWRDHVKRVPAIGSRAAQLRRIGTKLGLTRALDLKNVEYFDFYPGPEGFVGMRDRVEFELGPPEHRLQSLAHIIQVTGSESLVEDLAAAASRADVAERSTVDNLLSRIRAGAPIEPVLSDGHFGVPFANFRRADIERALARRSTTR